MEQDINVVLPEGVTEITIWKGNKLEPKKPMAINIGGVLNSVSAFLKGKEGVYNPLECHVLANRKGGSITFVGNDKSPDGNDVITGGLALAEQLANFKINSNKLFSQAELLKLVKMNRFFFAEPAQHEQLLKDLFSVNGKIEHIFKEVKNVGDGREQSLFETKVHGMAMLREFKLSVPIYEGYPKEVFRVEIMLDASNREVKFFLESQELYFLLEELKEKYIEQEIEKIKPFGCSIIDIS